TPATAHTRPTVADMGWTVAVEVPATATTIVVRHADADAEAKAWQLALDRLAPTPKVDRILSTLPDPGTPNRTPALLRGVDELERVAADPASAERHTALKVGMQVAYDAGEIDRSLALGRRALREALDTSQLANVIDVGEVLLHFTQDEDEKQWLLRLLDVSIGLAGDQLHVVRLTYFRSHWANARGDLGSSLLDAAKSEQVARRLGLTTDELAATAQRTAVLALIGDTEGSDTARRRILDLVVGRPAMSACLDAQSLTAAVRNLVARRQLGDASANPKPLLDRIAAYYEPGGGCDVGDNLGLKRGRASLHLYVAAYALEVDDSATARDAVAKVEGIDLLPSQRGWLAYIEAQLALRGGDPHRALRLTKAFEADSKERPLLSWKTALMRADAFALLGDDDAALRAALLAETVLDRAAGQLAPDQGREGMAAAFQVSAARAVAMQLAEGDVASAAATARRARSRRLRPVGSTAALASLDSDDRARFHAARARHQELSARLAQEMTELWRLPADERARATRHHAELEEGMRAASKEADALLRKAGSVASKPVPPAAGELTLLYHPLPEGWVAFAIRDGHIDAHRFELPPADDDEATSAALLAPFADAIADARRLRVLAVGELMSRRIHTLPWNGEPLVVAKPVAHGLDLEGSPVAALGSRTALVVADPATRIAGLGRLPNAAAEGAAVGERLRTLGWTVLPLSGEQAIHADVLAELARADWLHYAGHGVTAGHTGWESGLPLAGEAMLDVAAIMSAARVPPAIVLSACDTAGTATDGGASMQVATAFLLAGAEFVIAAQGGVVDESAPKFSAALYAQGGDLRGPELARAAVLALRAAGEPMSTWAGFHVWVR
ncbi:MAG TPA: CHAT domain-containing protein, partial [Nannocystaceae bacterium]|nr:CHAT domain-containing protein [Nannocystaceae bacterium]